MKRILLIFLLTFSQFSFSQSFERRDFTVSGGVGYVNLFENIFEFYGNNFNFESKAYSTYHFKAEYGLTSWLGIGIHSNTNYVKATYTTPINSSSNYHYKLEWKTISVLPRINVHFLRLKRLDAYAGLSIGYRFGGLSSESDNEDFGKPSIRITVFGQPMNNQGADATVGLRYYPVSTLGIYGEAGLANSLFQAGLVFKIHKGKD
jgi:hypothetical protein